MLALAKRLLVLLCIIVSTPPVSAHGYDAACAKLVARQRLQIARLRAELRALRGGRATGLRRASSTIQGSVSACGRDFDLASDEDVQLLSNQGCRHVNEIIIRDDVTSLAGLGSLTSANKLSITDSSLRSLWGLQNLNNVSGAISIAANVELTSLEGLRGLRSIATLLIEGNDMLESLAGLENLVNVSENFSILDNERLSSLEGLESLNSVGFLTMGDNPALHSLEGLESLRTLGDLVVADTKLESLSGLENVHTVTGKVRIWENDWLVTLSGLRGLQVAGELQVLNNDALRSINGFRNLRSEHLGVSDDGIDVLVSRNPNLKSLRGLQGLSKANAITIRENGITSLAGLENLVIADAILIASNVALDSLSGLGRLEIVGTLLIDRNYELTSMAGLRSLVEVPNELHISRARRLESLAGLENLTSVGVLRLTENHQLSSLVGLKSLAHAWGGIVILSCESLRSLLGLVSLTRTAQLVVTGSGPLQVFGGPFARGAQVGKIKFDPRSGPVCMTPQELSAASSAVDFPEFSTLPTASWEMWREHECGWELFTCTKGQACRFALANRTSSPRRVFISDLAGGCGACLQSRPQSDVGEHDLVDFGYELAEEEAGPYSICRCSSGVGPVGQLSLRGPRLSSQATVCTRGFNCTVKVAGEALKATDEVLLASDCSASPLVGFEASMIAENEYLLHGSGWYAATPTRYEVCWRAPCAPREGGTAACEAPGTYFKAGDVELLGVYVRDDMKLVLGVSGAYPGSQNFIVPNAGFGVSDMYDRMRLERTCGETDKGKLDTLEAKSSGMQFDFGVISRSRARAGSYRLCWCRVREGIECNDDQQFLADSGSVEIHCPSGWQLASEGRCERCPAGRQKPIPGFEPCEECPIGRVSIGGAVECDVCQHETYAELPGSSTCDPCLNWQYSLADGAGCETDPAYVVLGVAFLTCVGAVCAMFVQFYGWERQVVDVSLEEGQTIVTIFKTHGLSNKRGRSFPVKFRNTGHKELDSPLEPLRARVKDAARLELRTSSGEQIKKRLDTSMGTLLVPFVADVFHTGRPVPFAFRALLLSVMAVALVPALLTTYMAPVAVVGGPVVAMLCTLSSWAVRLHRLRDTPLTKRLAKFKSTLGGRQRDHSMHSCGKGPDRALTIGKLHELLDFFRDFIRDRTAYYLASNILNPLTKDEGVSYAELAGAEEVEWFVSHFWGTAFEHLCTALRRHAETACGEGRHWSSVRYWVCFCSNNQHHIAEELGESWKESSFYLTLRSGLCRGTCMVLDDQALPLTRIWCIFELLQTVLLERSHEQFQGLLLCTSSGVLNSGRGSVDVAMALAKKVAAMDVATARASKASDEEMIRSRVKEELGSFVTLNQFLRRAVRKMLVSARHNSNEQFQAVLALLDEDGDKASLESDQAGEEATSFVAEEFTSVEEDSNKMYVGKDGDETYPV